MKRRIIVGSMLVLCLVIMTSVAVSALPWEWSCQESRLVGARTIDSCRTDDVGTSCHTYDQNITLDCAYGCDNVTNVCSPPTYQSNLVLIAAFIILMIVMGYLLARRG